MNVYEIVTARIVEALERGTVPWHRPWGGAESSPQNLVSGRAYRGANVFLLGCAGYASPYWLTFNQARQRGGAVRKGEHGFPVIFWSLLDRKDRTSGKPVKIPLLRYFTVFNVAQCDGIEAPASPARAEHDPIEACERVVAGFAGAPRVEHGHARAFYRPSTDSVHLPDRGYFESPEAYYATLFHELSHATGHDSRLDRKGITDGALFGSHAYSREELVAEMGAAFLAAEAGIAAVTEEQSAAYLASWIRVLRGEPKLIVEAASAAQKAADHVLGRAQKREESEAA